MWRSLVVVILLIYIEWALAQSISYFEPANDGDKTKRAVLSNSPDHDLPNQFTICAAVFITFFESPLVPFRLLKDDGFLWFFPMIEITTKDTLDYQIYFYYEKKSYGSGVKAPLQPHTWSHICLSINVHTKNIKVVLNQVVIFEDTIEDAKLEDKPKTLKNNLA